METVKSSLIFMFYNNILVYFYSIKMNSISITYTLKYQLKFAPEYQFSGRKCFNVKTGRMIKRVVNGRCVGYCIRGKFHSLTRLRGNLEEIPVKEYLPF